MKHTLLIIVIFTIILSAFCFPKYAEASEGLPGSAKFGYGARIDIEGKYLDKSIELASSIGLDWVAVDFNWEKMWSDPSKPPTLNKLTDVIFDANRNGLSVLLTISNPASWVISEYGPDPQTTANLVLSLVNFYSEKVLAVELYPGVNTKESWKANPNATNYLAALMQTQNTLLQAGKDIVLITTITPEASHPSANDINDLDFISDLYALGGKPYLTIIGLKFNRLTGDPLTNPGLYALRHYEEVRSVMLENDHNHGTMWITGFRLPINYKSNIDQIEQPTNHFEEQSNWVEEAYKLMKAQLYIGASFFDQLNPNTNSPDSAQVTIISNNSNTHMIADRIMHLIEEYKNNNQPLNPKSYDQNQDNSNTNNIFSMLLNKIMHQLGFDHP